ncbi:rhomboid family intramembrane serine protease [Coralloluteibacterium stylophorae]|uniref:Rhomboid family intramembrane serine protease n=1 Tax=Coralloluteibacterium stylophorae TaxID=1776034 RepID=A0A8J8AYU2_9GAMM|nr:rhomboid family intramembrane serine protease [Coralloluteibacterium stylophorae]MBS7455601.1 rhomboid family intramembrane serine protease [Coralloluteibacterium stylophorae]
MFVTLGIIVVTCAVTILGWKNPRLIARLILWPPAVRKAHQYDRLVTSGFIHADVAHLAFNMITLFFFGRIMEQVLGQLIGPVGFALFYLSALLVSSLPSYLKHRADPNYRSLGASGAVTSVLFAFILVDPWSLIFVFFLPVPAIVYAVFYVGYSIYMDRKGGDNINHSAHLAGAIYGVLFMLLLEPRVLGHFLSVLAQPRFG